MHSHGKDYKQSFIDFAPSCDVASDISLDIFLILLYCFIRYPKFRFTNPYVPLRSNRNLTGVPSSTRMKFLCGANTAVKLKIRSLGWFRGMRIVYIEAQINSFC